MAPDLRKLLWRKPFAHVKHFFGVLQAEFPLISCECTQCCLLCYKNPTYWTHSRLFSSHHFFSCDFSLSPSSQVLVNPSLSCCHMRSNCVREWENRESWSLRSLRGRQPTEMPLVCIKSLWTVMTFWGSTGSYLLTNCSNTLFCLS